MIRTLARAAALGMALSAILAAPALAGKGNGRGTGGGNEQPGISCYQSGVAVTQVVSGTAFEIRGSGFRSWSPAWVCVVSRTCERTEVDENGNFSMATSLSVPYEYMFQVEVHQWRNRSGSTSEVVGKSEIFVTP